MVTPNVILLGNKVFEDVNKELWGHDGLEWALNPMTDVYTRRSYENLKTEKNRENGENPRNDESTVQGDSASHKLGSRQNTVTVRIRESRKQSLLRPCLGTQVC